MFRHIDPAEGPSEFWDLPYDERSRWLRAYLLAIASGAYPIVAWVTALDFGAETIQALHELVDLENADDARLLGLIERGAHPADRIIRLTLDG
jgi:hypothetical protein